MPILQATQVYHSGASCYVSRLRSAVAQDIANACNLILECDLFVLFPMGKSLNGETRLEMSAFLKTARDPSDHTKLMCGLASMHDATHLMNTA